MKQRRKIEGIYERVNTMKETELKPKYEEIQKLYSYCIKIGVAAEMTPLFDGYQICFPNGADFIQHGGSYGHDSGCVEPAIGCKWDYTAVPLKKAKALVRYHKDRLNKENRQ